MQLSSGSGSTVRLLIVFETLRGLAPSFSIHRHLPNDRQVVTVFQKGRERMSEPPFGVGAVVWRAVEEAGIEVMHTYRRMRAGLSVDLGEETEKKSDDPRSLVVKTLDPRSEATMEAYLRHDLLSLGYIGEELGTAVNETNDFRAWFDGIDGTIHCRHCVDSGWGVQCALTRRGQLVAAAINYAAVGTILAAEVGRGVWLRITDWSERPQWRRLQLDPNLKIEHPLAAMWRGSSLANDRLLDKPPLLNIRQELLRNDDPFCFSSTSWATYSLALGQIQLALAPCQSPWDYLPMKVMLRELGGGGDVLLFEQNDWSTPLSDEAVCEPVRSKRNMLAASSGWLLEQALAICQANPQPYVEPRPAE